MSKEAREKRKQEILDSIQDPKVREHYRAQLEMAEEFEGEGIPTAFHDDRMFVDERREEEHEQERRIGEAMADRLVELRAAMVKDVAIAIVGSALALCVMYLIIRLMAR